MAITARPSASRQHIHLTAMHIRPNPSTLVNKMAAYLLQLIDMLHSLRMETVGPLPTMATSTLPHRKRSRTRLPHRLALNTRTTRDQHKRVLLASFQGRTLRTSRVKLRRALKWLRFVQAEAVMIESLLRPSLTVCPSVLHNLDYIHSLRRAWDRG